MKAIHFLTAIIIFFSISVNAQECKDFEKMQKKIETEKVGYLTKELDLSVEEAQKFWPVYNEAQTKRDKLYIEKRKLMKQIHKNIDSMSDDEIKSSLDRVLAIDVELSQLKLNYHKKYEKILNPRKTAKLYQAEREFRKTLLRDIRKAHHGKMRP